MSRSPPISNLIENLTRDETYWTCGKSSLFSIINKCADTIEVDSDASLYLDSPHESKFSMTPIPQISQWIKVPA